VRNIFYIACLLLLSGKAFADGDIRVVLAPDEIPAGEQFTVIVAGNPVSKEQNRMVAIEFPESWKLVRAYAAEDGASESTSIDPYPEMIGYFAKEKGQTIKVFEDRTHVYAENYDGIAYFFVFSSAKTASNGNFKACFIERSDPGIPEKKVNKNVKKPTPARLKNFQWRIVSPGLGSNFTFAEISGKKYNHAVRFVTGWSNTSRALILHDSLHASAHLNLRPQVLQSFFNNPFTIEWWMHAVSGEQILFKFLRPDSLTGLTILANPFGQIDVRRFPSNSDSDIAILSAGTTCDGAWHHVALSCDMFGTLRIFTDGQLNDTLANANDYFKDLSYCTIGAKNIPAYFSIDELRFIKRAYLSEQDVLSEIAVTARDTLSDALALFHFEEFGRLAHSSISAIIPAKDSLSHPVVESISISLDSGAMLGETSSPVLFDHAVLAVEQSAPTKVTFSWKATSEFGVKRYELQRRIATFGEYEKMLSVDAKRRIQPDAADRPIISRASYSAAEKLPQLSHDIDLYYRLALIGSNDSVIHYTEPVKLEFGGARDVFVEQNKPNPFNPKTTINFRLIKKANVMVAVYDIIGREVAVLQDGKLSAGKHSIDIDATNWLGGIYFYKVKTAKTILTKKMVLAK
jgi:hypothetical protein